MIAKVRLERFVDYPTQRSGWAYAQRSLAPLCTDHAEALVLDTMVERNFARVYADAVQEGRIPYRRPWAGFVHVPPDIPSWHDTSKALTSIANRREWQESLAHCRGLLTLSRALRDWVRAFVPGVPVLALHHPTEFAERTFDFEAYLRHGENVVQVGWWLRRLASIHFLPLPAVRKHLLIPHDAVQLPRFLHALEAERLVANAPPVSMWTASVLQRLPNEDYDELLTRSVVFLDLHGAVANNAIIECMVRHTPVLVNRLPSTVEYLGADYPFFFDSLEEAAVKAADRDLVLAAHRFLATKDMSFLSGETFCRELAQSSLYQSW